MKAFYTVIISPVSELRLFVTVEHFESLKATVNAAYFNKIMTIQQAQNTVDEWIRTVGVRYYSELTNTAILMEEVGEVARIMSRLYGEQSF